MAGVARRGAAGLVSALPGEARQARRGAAGLVSARLGGVVQIPAGLGAAGTGYAKSPADAA